MRDINVSQIVTSESSNAINIKSVMSGVMPSLVTCHIFFGCVIILFKSLALSDQSAPPQRLSYASCTSSVTENKPVVDSDFQESLSSLASIASLKICQATSPFMATFQQTVSGHLNQACQQASQAQCDVTPTHHHW